MATKQEGVPKDRKDDRDRDGISDEWGGSVLSTGVGFVLWHLPVVGPLGRDQCLVSCVGGSNKWQMLEGSRIVSRIV